MPEVLWNSKKCEWGKKEIWVELPRRRRSAKSALGVSETSGIFKWGEGREKFKKETVV